MTFLIFRYLEPFRVTSTERNEEDTAEELYDTNLAPVLEKDEEDFITSSSHLQRKKVDNTIVNQNSNEEEIDSTCKEKNDKLKEKRNRRKAKRLVKKLQDHVNNVVKETSCLNCRKNYSEVFFLPCRHLNYCLPCSANHKNCPKCNQFIKERIKVFKS